jgi:hypothetical protein
MEKAIVIDTPEGINLFRLLSFRGRLKMEIAGMTCRGRSMYSIIKSEFNLKGNKARVLEQFERIVEEAKYERMKAEPASFEENKEINASYDREHGFTQMDQIKIGAHLRVLAERRAKFPDMPLPGDIVIVRGTEENYKKIIPVYENARIDSCKPRWGRPETMASICLEASVHIGLHEDDPVEPYSLSISGGYWIGPDLTELKDTGKYRRANFWTWGHCGATGNGGIYYAAPVKVWEYSNKNIY